MDINKIDMIKLKDISNMKHFDLYDEQIEEVLKVNYSKSSLDTRLMVLLPISIILAITLKGFWMILFLILSVIVLIVIIFRKTTISDKPIDVIHKMHRDNENKKQLVVSETLSNSIPNAVFFSKGGFTVTELTSSCLYKEYDYHYVQNMLLGVVGDVTYRACDVYTILSENIESYQRHSVMIELQASDIFDLPVLVLDKGTEVIDEIFLYRRSIKMYDYEMKVYEYGKVVGIGEDRKIVQAPHFHYSNILNDSIISIIKDLSKYSTFEITFIDDSIYIKLWDKSILTKEEIKSRNVDIERQKAILQDISSLAKILPKIRSHAYRSRWDKV